MNDKNYQLINDAKKIDHEARIENQKALVAEKEQLYNEALDTANKAQAKSGVHVDVIEQGAEAIRTRALAKQLEKEVWEAKAQLKTIEDQVPEVVKPELPLGQPVVEPVNAPKVNPLSAKTVTN